jgi:hypothetical protein
MKKVLTVLLAVAFVAAFTMPAMAADKTEWSFYGNARLQTFSYDDDANSGGGFTNGVVRFDDRDTTWAQIGNSRFGANAKIGNISGQVELRESTEWRIIWGEWDFGVGKLGVGKHYRPVNMFYSNQAAYGEINELWSGGVYNGADGMIRLRFQGIADIFDFDLAFVDPDANGRANNFATNFGGTYAFADIDTTLPIIEARGLFNWGALQIELNGGWLSIENVGIDGNNREREYDIDAWILAFGLKYSIGPFGFRGDIWTGENTAYMDQLTWEPVVATYDAATDSIIDGDGFGWLVVATFKVNDMLSLEAGYGEMEYDSNVAGATDDDVSSVYVQAVITPTPGVVIIPEIGELDYEDNLAGNDEGDTFYFGAVWKIYY